MSRLFTTCPLRRLLTIALLILFTLSLVGAALAENGPEEPAPQDYTEYNQTQPYEKQIYIGAYWETTPGSDQNEALYKVKNLLNVNGYYEEEVDLFNNKLDRATMNALNRYCWANNLSEYDSPRGLTNYAWECINQGKILDMANPTQEAAEEFPEIQWQQGGGRLEDLVNRLYDLKYLETKEHNTYDQDVKDALEKFGKQEGNGFPDYYKNDAEGEVKPIEADIQRAVMSENAKAYNPPKPNYFLTPVTILGIHTVMLVVWCAGLVVLLACVLAVIFFFFPSGKKADKNKKQVVHFEITYNGKTSKSEAEIVKTLKIGRGVGNFPLDLQDTKISRRHCELYYNNDVLMLRDYSANGTTVNGKPVNNAETILNNGAVVVIGEHSIVVTY